MIIHKKPEKIILDLLYTPDPKMISEQISRTGLICLCIERIIDNENIEKEKQLIAKYEQGIADCQNKIVELESLRL